MVIVRLRFFLNGRTNLVLLPVRVHIEQQGGRFLVLNFVGYFCVNYCE